VKVTLTNAFLLLAGAAVALAGDAVDGINGKAAISGGTMNSHWGENLNASLSLPVTSHLGLQTDGLLTRVGTQNFGGGGMHLFWRDSDKGFIGLTAGGIAGDLLYQLQGGIEAEYYIKQFTLGVNLGAATIQYNHPAPFIDTHPTDVYATASLSYYPLDNLMVQGAYSRLYGNNLGELLLEFQTPVRDLSLFAELAKGDNGYDHALFGLRYYFGKDKSLIRRHREDDPPGLLQLALTGIGLYGAKYNRAMHAYAAENLSSGYSTSGSSYGYTDEDFLGNGLGGFIPSTGTATP